MVKYILLFYIILITTYTDYRHNKIHNRHLVMAFSINILWILAMKGGGGFFGALIGCILPVILLFPFFILKMLPAGDIKLLGCIGSLLGFSFAVHTFVYGFLIAGVFALVVLIKHRILKERFTYMFNYIRGFLISGKTIAYNENYNGKDKHQIPLACCISAGALMQVCFSILGYFIF